MFIIIFVYTLWYMSTEDKVHFEDAINGAGGIIN